MADDAKDLPQAEAREKKLKPPDVVQINQQLERRVQELSTLYSIGKAVTSSLNLEQVLGRIVEAAVFLTNAEESFLLLVDEESSDLYMRAGKGLGERGARGFRVKVEDTIAGEVVRSGKPVNIGGTDRDTYKVKTGYLVKSLLSVPLKLRERVIGVLSVDNMVATGRPFSAHDMDLLSALADYAAVAIENARLYQRAESRAQELAQALEAKGEASLETIRQLPAAEQLDAMQDFIQILQAQRENLQREHSQVERMAQALKLQATEAEQIAHRLSLWYEEAGNVLPELRWLADLGGAQPTGGLDGKASAGTSWELIDRLDEGILISDHGGQVIAANDAACQILGVGREALVGKGLPKLWDDPRWNRSFSSLRLALALSGADRPPPPSPETTLWINERTVKIRLVPTIDDKGIPANIIVILRDVSPESKSWREQVKSLDQISLGLRTPMTAIAGYTDLLLSESVGLIGRAQRRYLQRIHDGVVQMDTFLRSLSEEKETQPLPTQKPKPAHLIVNEAVEIATELLKESGVEIQMAVKPDLPPLKANPDGVCQIIVDLLTVASHKMKAGEAVKIQARMQEGDTHPRHLIMSVRGRFGDEQEEHALLMARRLAEFEGGRTWIEQEPTGNQVVSLLLPVATEELGG
jgi:PAS domain S-box-containing protein